MFKRVPVVPGIRANEKNRVLQFLQSFPTERAACINTEHNATVYSYSFIKQTSPTLKLTI